MIDLHLHILPGVDDGSNNMYTSVQMGEIAEDTGTDIMVVTPHANMPGMYMNTYNETYRSRFKQLCAAFQEADLSIQLLQGMEIYVTDDVVEKLDRHELITLNHTGMPLVEFDFNEHFDYIYTMLHQLQKAGYRPLLAHPERYQTFIHEPQKLSLLKQSGILIQSNKSSILGHFGRAIRRTVDYFLVRGWVDVAASDAHGIHSRTPDLDELYYYLEETYHQAEDLLEKNPRRLLTAPKV